MGVEMRRIVKMAGKCQWLMKEKEKEKEIL
jgi:hypothetical protein